MKLNKSFKEIVGFIRNSRLKALYSVNEELINLYWNIGEYIHKKVESENWGLSVVEKLADYLRKEFNSARGFSAQNLWRMKQFYEVYKDHLILSALLRELSWTNNLMILSKCKTLEEKKFYIKLSIKEKYSSRELERQIGSGTYERFLLSEQKLKSIKRKTKKSSSVQLLEAEEISSPKLKNISLPGLYEVFKDKYIFEFLDLPEDFSEKDLQKALVRNLKNFILEIGKEFTFVGEEYPLQVGNKDFSVDLLFFHRVLQCLVVIELKIDEFKPEYIGKMNFYLEVIDKKIKLPHENPSVGLILCKSKDNEVVHYTMNRNLSPTLIAEYETKLINRKLLKQKFHELSGYYEKAEKVREIQEYYGTDPVFKEISKKFNEE